MKRKKNRFISIISNLFGIAALCGLFSLTSLSNRTVDETKADSSNLLYQSGIVGSIYPSWPSQYANGYYLSFVGDFKYYEVYQNGNKRYQYVINLTSNFVDSLLDSPISYPYYVDGDNTNSSYSFSSPLYENIDNSLNIRFAGVYSPTYLKSETQITFLVTTTNYSFNNVAVFSSNFNFGDEDFMFAFNGADANMFFTNTFNISDDNLYDNGYHDGYSDGYNNGYNEGQVNGINQGYEQGLQAGKQQQSQDDQILINQAYQQGYTAGYNQGTTEDNTVSTIFSGIMAVAMVPVDFFLAIFNFEILGVNISAMVTALLSLAITIIVIKLVMGKKGE